MLNIEPWWNWIRLGEIRVLWKKVNSPRVNDSNIRDPVCGKEFREAKYAGAMIKAGDKKYYFCSVECRINFLLDPGKYLEIYEDIEAKHYH